MTVIALDLAPPTGAMFPTLAAADPALVALAEVRRTEDFFCGLYDALEQVETDAEAAGHGPRPFSLIAWREYSAIGGHEIDAAHAEFLALPGADPKTIEVEYQDAKARYRAAISAAEEWDKSAGLTLQRRDLERASAARLAAWAQLAETTPTTPAGAAKVLDFVRSEMEHGEWDLHLQILRRVVEALRTFAPT